MPPHKIVWIDGLSNCNGSRTPPTSALQAIIKPAFLSPQEEPPEENLITRDDISERANCH
jgi:hypothetical protein